MNRSGVKNCGAIIEARKRIIMFEINEIDVTDVQK